MSDITLEIARELVQPTGQESPSVELHFGTVTAVDALNATVSVEIGGDTAVAGLPYLAWYSPTVNDRVFLFRGGAGVLMVAGTYRPIAGAALLYGTGTPESSVTAPIGVLYRRTDGGVNTSLYVKQSGTGNTGWGAVPTTNSAPAFTGTVTGASGTGAAVAMGAVGPFAASGVTLRSGGSRIWSGSDGSVATDDFSCDDLDVAGDLGVAGGAIFAGSIATGTVSATTVSASDVTASDDVSVGDDLTVGGDVGITGGALIGGAVAVGSLATDTISVAGHDFTQNSDGTDPHLNNWTPVNFDTSDSASAVALKAQVLLDHVKELTRYCNAIVSHLQSIGMFQ